MLIVVSNVVFDLNMMGIEFINNPRVLEIKAGRFRQFGPKNKLKSSSYAPGQGQAHRLCSAPEEDLSQQGPGAARHLCVKTKPQSTEVGAARHQGT